MTRLAGTRARVPQPRPRHGSDRETLSKRGERRFEFAPISAAVRLCGKHRRREIEARSR